MSPSVKLERMTRDWKVAGEELERRMGGIGRESDRTLKRGWVNWMGGFEELERGGVGGRGEGI